MTSATELTLVTQLEEAREEIEITQLQLQQVQEELDQLRLLYSEAEASLQRHRESQRRAEALIEALLTRLEARSGLG